MNMSVLLRLSAAAIYIGFSTGYAADVSLEGAIDSAIAEIAVTFELDEPTRRDLKVEMMDCLLRHQLMSEINKTLTDLQERCKVDHSNPLVTKIMREIVSELGRSIELGRATSGNEKSLAELQQILASCEMIRREIESNEVLERHDTEFDGFCPVSLRQSREWVFGMRNYSVTVDGKTYLMASAEHMEKFKNAPSQYIPVNGGFDVVAAAKNERVKGVRTHGLVDRDRTYLFATEDNLQEFMRRLHEFQQK